jgi:ribosomal protein S18 acetylase RimI-like enzyme
MHYTLRSVRPEEDALQRAVYASTRAQELASTGWPSAFCEAFIDVQHRAQQSHYRQHFPQALNQFILVGADVAGRLWTDLRPDALHILDITLLPEFRNQGLGTRCLIDLQQRAQDIGRTLSIQVELHNPARQLYERLGFSPRGDAQGMHQCMAWSAPHRESLPC